jgi:high-affinity Fe2+/Pb2+ permease
MSNGFLATVIGLILGAIAGCFAAIILGFALLHLLFTLQPPTGDVTGMGGLIILLIPFGVIIGAIWGVKLARRN